LPIIDWAVVLADPFAHDPAGHEWEPAPGQSKAALDELLDAWRKLRASGVPSNAPGWAGWRMLYPRKDAYRDPVHCGSAVHENVLVLDASGRKALIADLVRLADRGSLRDFERLVLLRHPDQDAAEYSELRATLFAAVATAKRESARAA
jgi:hypothetical protein